MRSRGRILLFLVAGVVIASCAQTPKHPGFEEAARSARLNARSAEGSRYYRLVERSLGHEMRLAIEDCRRREVDTRYALVLFRLDESGAILETILHPEDRLSRCIHDGIHVLPLPPPPKPDYWVMFGAPATGNPL